MIGNILTPMNHREIEYNAKRLSGGDIPDSFVCAHSQSLRDCESELIAWLDDTGKRVFDKDLIMDYGTDCLRLYLLFENTPKENDAPYYDSWQEGALEGIYKFLGRYRRMILAACEWNRRGNYNDGQFLAEENIQRISHALDDSIEKIRKYIKRGNAMTNRHNVAAALMELLNVYQKELKIGEIVTSFHNHEIETAVPHGNAVEEKSAGQTNSRITKLCMDFIILMSPYAPDMSKLLWLNINDMGC